MIKDKGRRQVRFRKDLGPLSVIASSGISDCPGNKNSGNGVVARIASGVRIGVKLLDQLDIQGRFLFILIRCQVETNYPGPSRKAAQAFTVSRQLGQALFQLPSDAGEV